jgi:hypothetical protein
VQPEMRPNEVLQKPPVSVIILQVEALYNLAFMPPVELCAVHRQESVLHTQGNVKPA